MAHTLGASGALIVSSALSLFITSHVLGASGRGVFIAANAWVGLFATFSSLSLGQVAIHLVAGLPREDWLPRLSGSIAAILGVVVLVAWAAAATLYTASDGRFFQHLTPGVLVLAFLVLPLLVGAESARYLLNAAGELAAANWAQIMSAVAGVSFMALFIVVLDLGIPGALLATLAAAGTGLLLCMRRLYALAPSVRVDRKLIVQLLGGSSRLHLTAVGNYLFTQAGVLVLNNFTTPAITAEYQLAFQIFSMMLLIGSSAGTVAFGSVAQHGPDGAWGEQRTLLLQSLILTAAAGAVVYLLAPVVIQIVAGDEFRRSADILRLLLPAFFGATLSTVMASQWIGRGLFWQASTMTFLSGIISVTTSFLLVPMYGVNGAVYSALLTYGTSVVVNGGMAVWLEMRYRRDRLRFA